MVKAAALAAVLVLYAASKLSSVVHGGHDVFSQTNFPCMEDEVLMYVVSPTNDRTGCVHLDDLRDMLITQQ